MTRRQLNSLWLVGIRSLSVICLSLSLFHAAQGQVRILVYGRVFLPDGQAAVQMLVNISGENGFRASTKTDGRGGFRFEDVPRSFYSLTVGVPKDASYYAEPVSVDSSREGNSFMADIFLRNPLEARRKEKLERVISAKEAAIPKDARKSLERAQKYREQKKFDVALTEIDKAIAIYPDYYRAICERGIIQINLGRPKDALKDFAKAIEIFPEYEPAVSGAGYCLLSLEQYEDAIAYLGRAIQLDPGQIQDMLFLGIANLAMSRWKSAQEILERALKLDGSAAVEAHIYLADAFAGQRLYSRAADELHTYLRLNPDAPKAERLREREKYFRSQKSQER